jgi:hypothetical protein
VLGYTGRMFNSNNNYLPDLNHYQRGAVGSGGGGAAAVAPHLPPNPAPMPDLTPTVPGPGPYTRIAGPFRFFSPTSGTAVPTWTPPMAPMATINMATAPGVGVSWQHSVPSPVVWGTQMVPHMSSHSMVTSSLPVYTVVNARL